MIGGGRTTGAALMIGSGILLIAFLAWIATAFGTAETTGGGLALGVVLALVVIAPIFGIGAYLFRKGTAESAQFETAQKQKKILNMVLAQGQGRA